MFEMLFWNQALEVVRKIPKEIAIAGAAYCLISDVLKVKQNLGLAEIKANQLVRVAELEVEALKLKKELAELAPEPETP